MSVWTSVSMCVCVSVCVCLSVCVRLSVCVCMCAYHKLLLVPSHAGASLGVLVGPDQQLDQSGDGALLTQSAVIGRAQGQVSDQTDGRLVEEKGMGVHLFVWSMMVRTHHH